MLTLSDIEPADAGTYPLVISNALGSVTTPAASLNPRNSVQIELKTVWPGRSNTLGLAISGRFAYVVQGTDGLTVLDLINPAEPVEVGSFRTNTAIQAIQVSGRFAYAVATDGLYVLDLSNPAMLALVGRFATPVVSAAVQSNYVYLAASQAGMLILDVSNPTQPTQVAQFPTTNSVFSVAVSGQYACIADGALRVIDISDPRTPVQVGSWTWIGGGGVGEVVLVQGRYVYVMVSWLGGYEDLRVVDLTNPSAPTPVASIPGEAWFTAFTRDQDRLYFVSGGRLSANFLVIDTSYPSGPAELGRFPSTRIYHALATSGRYAYLVNDSGAVEILEMTENVRLSVAADAGALHLTWASDPGEHFQIQRAALLPANAWTDVGEAITATRAITRSGSLPIPGSAGFYRVQIFP